MKFSIKFLMIILVTAILMDLSLSNGYLNPIQAQTLNAKGSIHFVINQMSVGQQKQPGAQVPFGINGNNSQQGSHVPTGPLGSLDAPVTISLQYKVKNPVI